MSHPRNVRWHPTLASIYTYTKVTLLSAGMGAVVVFVVVISSFAFFVFRITRFNFIVVFRFFMILVLLACSVLLLLLLLCVCFFGKGFDSLGDIIGSRRWCAATVTSKGLEMESFDYWFIFCLFVCSSFVCFFFFFFFFYIWIWRFQVRW